MVKNTLFRIPTGFARKSGVICFKSWEIILRLSHTSRLDTLHSVEDWLPGKFRVIVIFYKSIPFPALLTSLTLTRNRFVCLFFFHRLSDPTIRTQTHTYMHLSTVDWFSVLLSSKCARNLRETHSDPNFCISGICMTILKDVF